MKVSFITGAIGLLLIVACREQNKPAPLNDTAAWIKQGDSLVTHIFDSLRNTLLKAIGEKGFPGAIEFCNTEAIKLTAAYANTTTSIRRATDKFRNPVNKADSMEQRLLAYFQQQRKEQKEMIVALEQDKQGRKHYFKPIIMQGMCLNCHGNKDENISAATWEAIRKHYPGDLATGYKDGDIRGLWHILFVPPKN